MRLAELCKFPGVVKVHGAPGDLWVFGATEDSREVRPGDIFCAKPSYQGAHRDGVNYCSAAIAGGAQAIVVPSTARAEDLAISEYDLSKVVVIAVDDVNVFFSSLLRILYPKRPKMLAAVTGTNGKTSTASFLSELWSHLGENALSLGTLGLRGAGVTHTNLTATATTYDAKTTSSLLNQLVTHHSVSHLVMEASSHALHQQRLAALDFDIAGFTNLSHEHLDYHNSMAEYAESKLRLFTERMRQSGTAVLNVNDVTGRAFYDKLKPSRSVISYSCGAAAADLKLLRRVRSAKGQSLEIGVFGSSYRMELPFLGDFQAENTLCAIGLAIASGAEPSRAIEAASYFNPVPGRLELTAVLGNQAAIYVDFAHTPDALKNVLVSVRPFVRDRSLAVVFGCGGDRDTLKRAEMGAVAARLADRLYVTDDNPRTEDPQAIRRQIIEGIPGSTSVWEIPDRKRAIEAAIADLGEGDVLVIAGKGHEDYQIVAEEHSSSARRTRKRFFSDRAVIRELLRDRGHFGAAFNETGCEGSRGS
ncbi:UDP-N-acetylmuramoyl-L-alanyl-D-glutamate--2,6-diaminopimelate ligase [Ensifer sp. IC4062]|nr:UDP-N-acetylmuramoyl-L-alanyl-D-glutamate--2,6-diaminopimelate ligase [Ensifer sp. IC4062]MCA1441954.1 UDP-N-acetylmuramoyl-L-alanyl-D-glutamate--2,6-diaminopimelate ligase [Ensifer sp. IC4062]